MGEHGFEETAHEQARVQGDHDRVVAAAVFHTGASQGPFPVAPGDEEFGDTFDGDGQDKKRVPVHRAAHQRSRTSSEQNPGPIAISRPHAPGSG